MILETSSNPVSARIHMVILLHESLSNIWYCTLTVTVFIYSPLTLCCEIWVAVKIKAPKLQYSKITNIFLIILF